MSGQLEIAQSDIILSDASCNSPGAIRDLERGFAVYKRARTLRTKELMGATIASSLTDTIFRADPKIGAARVHQDEERARGSSNLKSGTVRHILILDVESQRVVGSRLVGYSDFSVA
jgi:hypothetical protein